MFRMTLACIAIGATAMQTLPAQQAAAAQVAAVRAVEGTVADPEGTPVARATIALRVGDSITSQVTADDNGRFRFQEVTATSATLSVRRLGFRPRNVKIAADAYGKFAPVFVTLEPAAVRLAGALVEDDSTGAPLSAGMRGFEQRRQTNHFGHYLDEDDIARMHPHYMSDALRAVPGVRIRPDRRHGNDVRIGSCGGGSDFSSKAGPLVWVDGMRMIGAELDDVVRPENVAGIEVYNALVGVPGEYFDRSASCGTILVWTKDR